MPKMTDATLQAMLGAQYSAAQSAQNSAKLSQDRARALDYYNGDLSKDLPAATGRSSAVSMDVADTIEGIMPQLMDVFMGGDEVVKFEPVGPDDEQAADQETKFINHVFLNQNSGFLTLYSFVKDALLSKTGVVKVWWDENERESKETYLDKSADEYAMLAADDEIEITAHTEHDGLHDVEITTRKNVSQARVMGVPPEEFGIEPSARTIRDANYCFHKIVDRTEQDLIDQGYDAADVKKLPSYRAWTGGEEQSRDMNEETASSPDNNTATRRVEITEHYIRMDYEGSGKACLYRVTTGGPAGQILHRDGKPDVIEFDVVPFAAMTPIIVTHRFYGRSLADLVLDIQKIKTALLRQLLDNAYLSNNPRVEVGEDGATDNTLDDLLVSRPGGVVRTKRVGSLAWQVVPNIAQNVYPLVEYMDGVREWRTGVTKQGQGIDANALQNQSATAVNQAFTASQARVRLIARIFAETGIRDMFWLLHKTIKQHANQQQAVKIGYGWVPVDPREWQERDDLTIHVGLGTGSRAEQAGRLAMIAQAQEKMLAGGMTNIVPPDRVFNLAAELTKVAGYKDPQIFFADPDEKDPETGQPKNPAPQPQPDPAMLKVQADMQIKQQEMQFKGQELQAKAQIDQVADQRKAQIEQVQAQADIETQDRKMQAEMALAQQRFALERELKLLDYQLKREQHDAEMQMKRELHAHAMRQGEFNAMASVQKHEMAMDAAGVKHAE